MQFIFVDIADRTIENGHSDLEEDEVSDGEDSDLHSISSDDNPDDVSDNEDDDDVEDIDDDEDSDMEVSMSSKDATILTLHKRLGVLQMNFNNAKLEFEETVEKFEAQLKAKVTRLIFNCFST